MTGLFHDDCGSLLEHETLETEEGEEVEVGYCSSCDEYADDIQVDWDLTEEQEEKGIEEMLDEDLDRSTTNYNFSDCEHDEAYTFELSAGRGDEDNLIVYKCADCGNTERDTQTTWG